jgi:predicted DNA repair protein MutK
MLGGAYLCFEATEKIFEVLTHTTHAKEAVAITDPAELEERQVAGAIRTDFILSAEITAIALNELPDMTLTMQGVVLAAVAVAITAGVYGAVALIVKMDDVGLHLSLRADRLSQAVGHGLVRAMPALLRALATIGTAAMLWVGGGIFLHGLHEYHLTPAPEWVDAASHAAGAAVTWASGAAEWLAHALGAAIVGLIVGGMIVGLLHFVPRKRQSAAH